MDVLSLRSDVINAIKILSLMKVATLREEKAAEVAELLAKHQVMDLPT